MATYKQQVEGLTGLTIGTAPTDDELTQFLTDGAADVINRLTASPVADIESFTGTEDIISVEGCVVKGSTVVGVVRADGDSATNLNPASRIGASLRYRAADEDSLSYRSVYNPCWYILDGTCYVLPVPDEDENIAEVTFVKYPAVAYGDVVGAIENFSGKYQYLVGIYAAVQSLENAISAIAFPDDVVYPPLPIAPTLSDSSITFSADIPVYSVPIVSLDFADAETLMDDDDTEMVAARLKIISTQLEEHGADIKNAMTVFEKEKAIYEVEFKTAMENAKLESQDDVQKIQKYNGEVQSFQSESASLAKDYEVRLQKSMADMKKHREAQQNLLAQYMGAFPAPPQPPQQEQQQRRSK